MLASNPNALCTGEHNKNLHPVAQAAAVGYTDGLDRLGYDWALVTILTGDTTGNPTSFSVTVQVQDDDAGDAGGSAGADYTDVSGVTKSVTTVNSTEQFEVDLRGLDRYVRGKATIAFVGGAAPTVGVCVLVQLFNKDQAPVLASDAPAS